MAVWDIKERYKKARANEIRGDRAIFSAGQTPSNVNTIDYVGISSTGNATDFGDLTSTERVGGASASSHVRAIISGGAVPGGSANLDYIYIASTGNAADFGDLGWSAYGQAGMSNSTRGIFSGGSPRVDTIEYITIGSTGNGIDFGNLSAANFGHSSKANTTRGIFAAGETPSARINVIEYIDLDTLSNAIDFGDLASIAEFKGTACSATRYLACGGQASPAMQSTIDTVQIATTGNSTDYGDILAGNSGLEGTGNLTRAIFGGGGTPSVVNVIQYVSLDTAGNTVDFGDLSQGRSRLGATSSGHGGLDIDTAQRPSVNYMPGSGRALSGGGQEPSNSSHIHMIHIPTTGNESIFGDLTAVSDCYGAAFSSVTRSVHKNSGGGYATTIDAVEFQSQGNAADFGDLTAARENMGGLSSATRGCIFGGHTSPGNSNVIDYATIATMADLQTLEIYQLLEMDVVVYLVLQEE